MSAWLTIEHFQEQFSAPPSRDTIRQWALRGEVELKQPGGPRGRLYVRWRDEARPESEQTLLEALHAAQAEKSRKQRA